MKEPISILDKIALFLAVLTLSLFLGLAAIALQRASVPAGLVFIGFAVVLGLAIHAERSHRRL